MIKHIVHVQACLCRRLEECQSVLLCESLSLRSLDHLVGAVAFVGNEDLGHVGVRMLLNLLQPVRNVVEGLLVSTVVHKNDAHCALVIGLSDSAETFLARCVPHLQLYSLVIHIDLLDFEVNTYD